MTGNENRSILPERVFTPPGTIMDTYAKRYLELASHICSLYSHDLKNCQNAISMSMDLYEMTGEKKYLDMITDASGKTLEHLNLMKSFEPIVYSGKNPGLYSIINTIQNSMTEAEAEFELTGNDAIIFADASLQMAFKLLISAISENEEKPTKVKYEIKEPAEDSVCFIDMTFSEIPK